MGGAVIDVRQRLVNALLLILLLLIGLLPFVLTAARTEYIERALLPITSAVVILVIGFVYDASERSLGLGKGIYTAAILCSTSVFGVIASDPGWLGVGGLAVMNALALWLAVSAKDDNRISLLTLLIMLLACAGLILHWSPFALPLAVPLCIAAWNGARTSYVVGIGAIAFLAGSVSRDIGMFTGLPVLIAPPSSDDATLRLAGLLPWSVLLLAPLVSWRKHASELVPLIAAILALLTATFLTGAGMFVLALASPSMAYLIVRYFLVRFNAQNSGTGKGPDALASLFIVLSCTVLFVWTLRIGTGNRSVTILLAAVVLSLGILFSSVRGLPRWSFGLTVILGLGLSSLFWHLRMESPALESAESTSLIFPFVIGASVAAACWISIRGYLGTPIPRALLQGEQADMRYSEEGFFRFDLIDDNRWGGKSCEVDLAVDSYKVAFFGDITGSESPVSTRRGGYITYRRLTAELNQQDFHFAVSLGDFATKASEMSFRRVRKMLRHVRVPITAIPGNHDVVNANAYDSRYFLALFQADNRAFVVGPVHYILLNNAWGNVRDTQFEWLETILSMSTSKFKIVCCHKPPFDPRPHEIPYHMEWREHAERLHQLFCAFSVTAVLSGHIHTLLHDERDGVHYIISGGGGSKLVEESVGHHYLQLEVTPGRITFHAVPIAGKRTDTKSLMEMVFSA